MPKTYSAVKISEERLLDYGWIRLRRLHTPAAISLDRWQQNAGVPWLADHSNRIRDQIGVTANPAIRANALHVDMSTMKGDLARDMEERVDEGYTRGISVDWRVLRDVDEPVIEEEDGTFTVARWEVVEVSSIPVPRDAHIGFGAEDCIKDAETGLVLGGRDYYTLEVPPAATDPAPTTPPIISGGQDANDPAPTPTEPTIQPDSTQEPTMELFDLLSAVADSFKDLLDDDTRNRLLMQALRDKLTGDQLDAIMKNEIKVQRAAADAAAQSPEPSPTPAQPPVPHDSVPTGSLDKINQAFKDHLGAPRFTLPKGDLRDMVKENAVMVSDTYRKLELQRRGPVAAALPAGGQDALLNTTTNAQNQFAHTVDSYAGALIEMSALRQYLRTRVGATGEYQRPSVGRLAIATVGEGVAPTDQAPAPGGLKLTPDHAVVAGFTESRAVIQTWTADTIRGIMEDAMGVMVEGMDADVIAGAAAPRGIFNWRTNEGVPAANLIAKADLAGVTYESLGELYQALLDQKVGDSPLFWILSNSVFIKGLVSERFTNGRDAWFDGGMLLMHPAMHSSHATADKAALLRGDDISLVIFDDDIVVEVNTLDSVNYKYSMSQMFNFGSVHYETVARFT